jgi:hypothetical protein
MSFTYLLNSRPLLDRQILVTLDRANQAAAKTVRRQPCLLARPRPSGSPGGKPPGPFHAPHPLRYPFVLRCILQGNTIAVKALLSLVLLPLAQLGSGSAFYHWRGFPSSPLE